LNKLEHPLNPAILAGAVSLPFHCYFTAKSVRNTAELVLNSAKKCEILHLAHFCSISFPHNDLYQNVTNEHVNLGKIGKMLISTQNKDLHHYPRIKK
jgi:hypothetical protein